MAVEVIFPKVDMDMDKGSISRWHVKDGDTVQKGQAVFEIETDKSAMEIEAPAAGTIRRSDVAEGTSIAIGTVVAMIYASGEDAKAFSNAVPVPANLPNSVAPENQPQVKVDRGAEAALPGAAVRATPLARRLARQAGLPLAALVGTGPRGRIVAADVNQAKPSVSSPSLQAKPLSADNVRDLFEEGTYDVKPLDGMRRIIAERLTQSKQTIPHFYLSATCTVDLLLATRERLNAQAPRNADKTPIWKLSINDFVIKAYALALQRVPEANATFTETGILLHRASDVGVAISVEGGLFTPVIRSAERKSLAAISTEVKELAAKARARKLQPHEYKGGSAAVSNLGMFGVEQFTAIINPPHASILAVGAAVERFVPVNKQPVLATQISVTLSVDHRAVDGAAAAVLLAHFKALLEDPALMLV